MITEQYRFLKEKGEQGSVTLFARKIAERLGYSLDKNNCNSFVLSVLREEITE